MLRNVTILCTLLSVVNLDAFCQKRIINGAPVVPPAMEWMAGLSSSTSPLDHFCGGALIAPNWVVSAAHCLEGETPQSVKVFFKTYYLSNPVVGSFTSSVDEIILHPNYISSDFDNDIALIKLKSNAVGITPIKIMHPTQTYLIAPGKNHTTAGWGLISNDDFITSDTLLKATVPIVATATCNGSNSYDGQITENMLCAGYLTGGTDACSGDSGGPLFTTDSSGSSVLTGIVSWGEECGLPNFPGVYAKVAQYYDWIVSKTATPSWLNDEMMWQKISCSYQNNSFQVSSIERFISIEVYDVSGRAVIRANFYEPTQTATFNSVNLSGIYLVLVGNGSKFATIKVVCN